MKLDDADVMAYPQKLVEHTILGLSDPLNRHLRQAGRVSISRRELRQHFRREVQDLAARRFSASHSNRTTRTGSFKFYFDLLFDYPFGGVEVRNMRLIMDDIADNYRKCAAHEDDRKKWSNGCGIFIRKLAERLHNGEDVLDMIPE